MKVAEIGRDICKGEKVENMLQMVVKAIKSCTWGLSFAFPEFTGRCNRSCVVLG